MRFFYSKLKYSLTTGLRARLFCTSKDKSSTVISKLNDINESLAGGNWEWVPPKSKGDTTTNISLDSIPIKLKTLLTADEITSALEKAGGINVKTTDLNHSVDVQQVICVTGFSRLHLERMSDIIHRALKKREIPKSMAPGVEGSEGLPKDDWIALDCGTIIVNFMLEETRNELNLEDWITRSDKPLIEHNEIGIPAEILDEFSISDKYFEVAHGTTDDAASIGRDIGNNHYELYEEPMDLRDLDRQLDEFDMNTYRQENVRKNGKKKGKKKSNVGKTTNDNNDDDVDFETLLNTDDSINMEGVTINGMPLGSLDDPKAPMQDISEQKIKSSKNN